MVNWFLLPGSLSFGGLFFSEPAAGHLAVQDTGKSFAKLRFLGHGILDKALGSKVHNGLLRLLIGGHTGLERHENLRPVHAAGHDSTDGRSLAPHPIAVKEVPPLFWSLFHVISLLIIVFLVTV